MIRACEHPQTRLSALIAIGFVESQAEPTQTKPHEPFLSCELDLDFIKRFEERARPLGDAWVAEMWAAGVENPVEAFYEDDYGMEDSDTLKKKAMELANLERAKGKPSSTASLTNWD